MLSLDTKSRQKSINKRLDTIDVFILLKISPFNFSTFYPFRITRVTIKIIIGKKKSTFPWKYRGTKLCSVQQLHFVERKADALELRTTVSFRWYGGELKTKERVKYHFQPSCRKLRVKART